MKVGLQLYSVRQSMHQDVRGTLEKMCKLGYKYMEVANHNEGKPYQGEDIGIGFGVGPQEIRQMLHQLGGEIIGVHLFPFPFEEKRLRETLAYHKIIGTKYVCVPNGFYAGMQDIRHMIDQLNRAGRICAEEGFTLMYHNHYHEFQQWEGKTILDHLMEGTDPDLVVLELDTVWAMMGGANVLEIMKRYGKRIQVLHQKDYARAFAEQMNVLEQFEDDKDYISLERFVASFDHRVFTEVGSGLVDIQSIIDAANAYCQCEYIVLEQDYTELGEMESVEKSMSQFKKYTGIQWD